MKSPSIQNVVKYKGFWPIAYRNGGNSYINKTKSIHFSIQYTYLCDNL